MSLLPYLTTGSLGLDLLIGGWPRGKIVEIWGEPGTGKTTLAKMTLQHRHIQDRHALWVDTSGASQLAADPCLIYLPPRSAEDVFNALVTASGAGLASLAIVDDANHLVRQRELDDDPDYVPDEHREFKDELKTLKYCINNSGMTTIFLSQPRDTQRAPIRGTGLSEKAALRVTLNFKHRHQSGDALVFASVKYNGQKTMKTMVPLLIRPGHGIVREREIIHNGLQCGLIQNSASWFYCPDIGRKMKWQGVEALEAYLADPDNRWIKGQLENKIREKYVRIIT